MRNQKTVLVLGAGASRGFGLPLGADLRNTIADDLNIKFDDWGQSLQSGSYEIVEAFRLLVQQQDGRNRDINPLRHAAVQISGSMRLSGSIDEYIERHKDDPLKVQCAKLAIAKAILKAERESTLYADPRNEVDVFENASGSWLAYVLRDLTRGLGRAALASGFENVTIVDFNYDRCIEQFCHLWFQRIYDLTEGESAALCQGIKIYHPYGSLGPLRYQNPSNCVPYGGEINARRLIEIAGRIRTYSEAFEEAAHPKFVLADLADTRRMVFLGFGFHRQNVELLGATKSSRPTLHSYATIEGIREPRIELIKQALANAMQVLEPAGFFFEGVRGDCEAFWEEYGEVVVQ